MGKDKRLVSWIYEGLQGLDRGLGGLGREGSVKQQGIVFAHQALGDTLKHIHSFTH